MNFPSQAIPVGLGVGESSVTMVSPLSGSVAYIFLFPGSVFQMSFPSYARPEGKYPGDTRESVIAPVTGSI